MTIIYVPPCSVQRHLNNNTNNNEVVRRGSTLNLLTNLARRVPMSNSNAKLTTRNVLDTSVPICVSVSLLNALLFRLNRRATPTVTTTSHINTTTQGTRMVREDYISVKQSTLFRRLSVLPMDVYALMSIAMFVKYKVRHSLITYCHYVHGRQRMLFVMTYNRRGGNNLSPNNIRYVRGHQNHFTKTIVGNRTGPFFQRQLLLQR